MATVVGAYTYRTQRAVPGSGEVTLASDPIAGYTNTLRVSETDRFGNSRTTQVAAIASGNVLSVDVYGRDLFPIIVTGAPADAGTYRTFPVTIRNSYVEDGEPPDGAEVILYVGTAGTWPELADLAQIVMPAGQSTEAWEDFLEMQLASAIQVTKGETGNWDDTASVPNSQLSAAALRLAEMMAERPDATVESLLADATFQAHMAGQHKRFPFA